MTAESLARLKPMLAKVDPEATVTAGNSGIEPVPAVQEAIEKACLTWEDIDLVELNHAFAAQVLACFAGWGLSERHLERVNVNGSGISLGHPIGATGGRILANLLRELRRRDARYGIETMCVGCGQGLAAVIEAG